MIRSYLLFFAVVVQLHVAVRRNDDNDNDLDDISMSKIELESGLDSSTLSLADVNMSADVITIQGVTMPNPAKFVEKLYNSAKAKYEAAKAYVVKTLYLARQKWGLVRNSLKLTTESAIKVCSAILNFIKIFKKITASIINFGLERIFDGRFGIEDLKIVTRLKETWQIVKDILSSTWQMRFIIYWSVQMLGLIKNVKSLAGFAIRTGVDVITGGWQKNQSGSLMDVSGDTAEHLALAAEVQDAPAWFSNAWVKAKANLLDKVSKTISGGVVFFENSARSLEGIEKVIAPLGTMNAWDTTGHIFTHGSDLVTKFNELGSEYTKVRDGVDNTYRPMSDQSREVSISFYTDAKSYEPGRIDKSKCDWKWIQFLDDRLKVDDSSMWCKNLSLIGKKICWCKVTWRDCYVKEANRPQPKELRRCFIPYVPSKNDFYNGS
eukprot:TRINITY_DN385_c2_g2_i1.p1 TRINITY_DN385_c2_g2~~TRINITY_DN385_c2_g2_i1.p1  ORF type:complete len:457 (-),score=67.94 TRINITY_DN385_c2_g2_i1:16-1320(-)